MNPNLFVNRVEELEFLNRAYQEGGRQLVVIYGRRRVGKTELLNHFSKDKNAVYFLADKRGTEINADRFAIVCANHFSDIKPSAKNFDDIFVYIKNRVKNEKLIVIIDEFSYLVEKDESIPSVFQLIFDEILKDTNVFLVLCGSSISMMYKGALSYESPLYGRRTGEWNLAPMKFNDVKKFYPSASFEEAVMIYSIVGGIPAYSLHFGKDNLFENIKSKMLTKGEFLYNEPEIMLREELREPSTYFSILEAMASSAKLTEIANAARVPANDMPKYLKVLESLELVRKENPVTEKKTKKSLYFIKDNFFNFWFRFVYPKKSELEAGRLDEVLSLIKRDFNSYVGFAFEKICKEYLEEKKPVSFSKLGKWWNGSFDKKTMLKKNVEIDIVALDESAKVILFGECKWTDELDGARVLDRLKEKAKNVRWNEGERTEYFAVFAKSFSKKANEKNCFFFDGSEIFKGG